MCSKSDLGQKKLFNTYSSWCASRGLDSVPSLEATIIDYLWCHAEKYSAKTLYQTILIIRHKHRAGGLPHSWPDLAPVLKAIRRRQRRAPRQISNLDMSMIEQMIASLPQSKRGLRDRAMLLVAFWSGLRVSELIKLNYVQLSPGAVGTIRFDPAGLKIELIYFFNRKCSPARIIRLEPMLGSLCPVAAVREWIDSARLSDGPLFPRICTRDEVSGNRLYVYEINNSIKDNVANVYIKSGYSDAEAKERAKIYSSESVRLAFVLSALEAGISIERLALYMGYMSTTCLERIRRRHYIIRDNPVIALMNSSK